MFQIVINPKLKVNDLCYRKMKEKAKNFLISFGFAFFCHLLNHDIQSAFYKPMGSHISALVIHYKSKLESNRN